MSLPSDISDATLQTPQGSAALAVAEALQKAGHEAWWVGGAPRDMLRVQVPTDIDLATNAVPDEVAKLFPKVDSSKPELGTTFVHHNGEEIELTTYREESALSDGRLPSSVQFSDRETDAKRRDFTVNALYWNPVSGELFDPYEGEADLQAGLVRFIGDPVERIEHDALRLLRAIRLRAHIQGQYHPDTFQALHSCSQQVSTLSGTRRLEELQKMLMGAQPTRALEDLWETDVLEHMIPELYACKGIPQPADYHKEGDVWDHQLQCVQAATEEHGLDVRLATLFHDCGKVDTFALKERIRFDEHASVSAKLTKEVLDRLQCSGKRRDKICWLISHHMMMGSFADMNDQRKAHWYYHPWFTELLQLFWLDIAGTTPSDYSLYDSIVQDYNQYLDTHPRPPKPLLTGEDVMEILGIQPGPKVGEVLQQLEALQLQKSIQTIQEAKKWLSKQYLL